MADLGCATGAVIDAGGVEVVAGIDVGLGDVWVAAQTIVAPGASDEPLAGVQVPRMAFGSVMVAEAIVVLPLLVAVIW